MEVSRGLSLEAAAGRDWEAVVVGAGPAGAVTARELARLGRSVLLVDRAVCPRYKVCGCCLNGRAVGTLAELGLGELLGRCGAVPLDTFRIGAAGRDVSIRLPGGVALSRASLDAALVAAAVEAGAAFLPDTVARLGPLGLSGRTVQLEQRQRLCQVRAGVVVAADGLGSRSLRGEADGARLVARGSRVGAGVIVEAAVSGYRPGCIYMACGERGYVGLVRLEDGRLNVAAAFDVQSLKAVNGPGAAAALILDEVRWPAVPGIHGLGWRGTPWLTSAAPRIAGGRLFVVGDAAGYVEPFTGEGIGWALAMARAVAPLAAQACVRWEPRFAADWERRYRSAVGSRRLCRWSAWVLRRAALRRACLAALAIAPSLAASVMRRVHGRRARSPIATA